MPEQDYDRLNDAYAGIRAEAKQRQHGGAPTPASVFPPRDATEPEKPTPDGKIVVRTIYGKDHTFHYKDMPHGWKTAKEYLQISLPSGFRRYPWGQILWFDTVANSAAYSEALKKRKAWELARLAKKEEEEGTCDA